VSAACVGGEAAALDLAAAGYNVFPIRPGQKVPATRNGVKDATTAERTILTWWDRAPGAGIGVATGSGLIVLDVDGEQGAESLRVLEAEHGELPVTVTVETPGGGRHYHFSTEKNIRNSAGKLGAGLDIRGDGGYVVAPPSQHPNGGRYEWLVGPDECPVAQAPGWLVELLREQRREPAAKIAEAIPDGERNSTLASLAGSMRRRGMGESEILAALAATNAERCRPPLDPGEVEQIAASICKYPAGKPAASGGTGGHSGSSALPEVTWTDTKPPKLVLPEIPHHEDIVGLCGWLTVVLRLDRRHPATGAVHQGLRGADGHVELRRAGVAPIRFEPAGAILSARKLHPILAWQLEPTDGEPYGFRDEDCRKIAHVLRLLCGAAAEATEAQETTGIVGTFLAAAEPVEGLTSYGTGAERYEALTAMQRPLDDVSGRALGPPRYLIDANTGELVIRASDLQAAARLHVGASLERGWLDARLDALAFERLTLDGRAVAGRAGRHSPHARAIIYRGHLPAEGGSDER
jgi:hypothetical protein